LSGCSYTAWSCCTAALRKLLVAMLAWRCCRWCRRLTHPIASGRMQAVDMTAGHFTTWWHAVLWRKCIWCCCAQAQYGSEFDGTTAYSRVRVQDIACTWAGPSLLVV
jgi:hypothetical protein